MNLLIAGIGFTQAILAYFLILGKKPTKISYLILSYLILVFTVMFGLDILSCIHLIPSNRWFISLGFTLMIPPLFFLYAKHITKVYNKFHKADILHFTPSLILLLLFVVLILLPENKSISNELFFAKYNSLKIIYGLIFHVQLIFYTILSLKIVINFKRKSKYYYSYNSYKVSLNWLIVMVVVFFIINLIVVISSTFIELNNTQINMEAARNLIKLFFVYVLSIWGFNQNQLNSTELSDVIENNIFEAKNSVQSKYQKSGLRSDVAKEYIQILSKIMEESEVWKDTELSISKLANQTSIPKHHLSEVLNEHLGKSFYNFVNEYRIEYAKKLLKSNEYANWSILAIAYECGFNSKAVFNSFFKKYTQLTPSEYKKNK